jgi:hypothetical protein
VYAGKDPHPNTGVRKSLQKHGIHTQNPELAPGSVKGPTALRDFTYESTLPVPEAFMMYRSTDLRKCRFSKSIRKALERRQDVWSTLAPYNPIEDKRRHDAYQIEQSLNDASAEAKKDPSSSEEFGLSEDLVWVLKRMAAPSPFFVTEDNCTFENTARGLDGKAEHSPVNGNKWTMYANKLYSERPKEVHAHDEEAKQFEYFSADAEGSGRGIGMVGRLIRLGENHLGSHSSSGQGSRGVPKATTAASMASTVSHRLQVLQPEGASNTGNVPSTPHLRPAGSSQDLGGASAYEMGASTDHEDIVGGSSRGSSMCSMLPPAAYFHPRENPIYDQQDAVSLQLQRLEPGGVRAEGGNVESVRQAELMRGLGASEAFLPLGSELDFSLLGVSGTSAFEHVRVKKKRGDVPETISANSLDSDTSRATPLLSMFPRPRGHVLKSFPSGSRRAKRKGPDILPTVVVPDSKSTGEVAGAPPERIQPETDEMIEVKGVIRVMYVMNCMPRWEDAIMMSSHTSIDNSRAMQVHWDSAPKHPGHPHR